MITDMDDISQLSHCPRCGATPILNHDKDGYYCPNAIKHLVEDGENLIKRIEKYGLEPRT